MQERMDAAGAVDAQNAPTAPWKTAQNAVSHSAHTRRRQLASHTKFRTLPGTRELGTCRDDRTEACERWLRTPTESRSPRVPKSPVPCPLSLVPCPLSL